MTPTQSILLASLMARHFAVTLRLGTTYPAYIDRVADDFCAVSRDLVALRREIQRAERMEGRAA